MKMSLIFSVLAAASGLTTPAFAQQKAEDFANVDIVLDWFRNLTFKWSRLVDEEERKQILRASNSLSRKIYSLISDTELLLLSIPDQRPTKAQLSELQIQVDALQKSVDQMRTEAVKVGPLIGIDDTETAKLISTGGTTRKAALSYLEAELLAAGNLNRPWNPGPLRTRLQTALDAMKAAQVALFGFQRKVADQKP